MSRAWQKRGPASASARWGRCRRAGAGESDAEKFISFELLALAERWGGNAYNGRLDARDFGPAPIGFVLRLAGDSAAERVAPLFFKSYGWK